MPGGAGSRATERIKLIIEAAEQAAAGIIEDAEAQAKGYVEESRARADQIAARRATKMWALTDDLIGRAEAVRRQTDELLQALDEAKRGVEEALRVGPVQTDARPDIVAPDPAPQPFAPQPQPDRLRPVESQPQPDPFSPPELREPALPGLPPQPDLSLPPQPDPGLSPPPSAPGNPPSEGARLLATQMAVAGSNRAEIESRLRHEFGISDTGAMLDAILGPGR